MSLFVPYSASVWMANSGNNVARNPNAAIPAGAAIIVIHEMGDATGWPGAWTAPTDDAGNSYTFIFSNGYNANGRTVGLNVYLCLNSRGLPANGAVVFQGNFSGIGLVLYGMGITGYTYENYINDVTTQAGVPYQTNGVNGGQTCLGIVASTNPYDGFTQPNVGATSWQANSFQCAELWAYGNASTNCWLGVSEQWTPAQSNPAGGGEHPSYTSFCASPATHIRAALVFNDNHSPRPTGLFCHTGIADPATYAGYSDHAQLFNSVPAGSDIVVATSGAGFADNIAVTDSAGNTYTPVGSETNPNVVTVNMWLARNVAALAPGNTINFALPANGSYATVAAAYFPNPTNPYFKTSTRGHPGTAAAIRLVKGETDSSAAGTPLQIFDQIYDEIIPVEVDGGASIGDYATASQMTDYENMFWWNNTIVLGTAGTQLLDPSTVAPGQPLLSYQRTMNHAVGHARLLAVFYSVFQPAKALLAGQGTCVVYSTNIKAAVQAAPNGVGQVLSTINYLIRVASWPLAAEGFVYPNPAPTMIFRETFAQCTFGAYSGGAARAVQDDAQGRAVVRGTGFIDLRTGFKIYQQIVSGQGFVICNARHWPTAPAGDTLISSEGFLGVIGYSVSSPRPFRTIDYYVNLFTSEHQGKSKLTAASSAILLPLSQTQALLSSMPDLFDIDRAVGVQLDKVGQWVGRNRFLEVPINAYFSYDTDGYGLDQGHWKGAFDPDEGLWRLEDDFYRALLHTVIGANNWDGSIPGAYAAWGQLMFNVLIQDTGHMSAVIALQGPVPNAVSLTIFTSDFLKMRPAGIKVIDYMVETVDGAPFFGYDVANSNIAGYDGAAYGRLLPPSFVSKPTFGFLVQSLAGEGFVIEQDNVIVAEEANIGGAGYIELPVDQVGRITFSSANLVGRGAITTFRVGVGAMFLAGQGYMPINSFALHPGAVNFLGQGAIRGDAGAGALITGTGNAVMIALLADHQTAPTLAGQGTLTVHENVIRALRPVLAGQGSATATWVDGPWKGAIAFLSGAGSLSGKA